MPTSRRRCGAQGCRRSALSAMWQLVGAVCFCAALSVAAAGSFKLTILHTNDVHARLEQTSRDSGKCSGEDCYGGVARRATKIRQIRASHRNVLLLDAGDQYQGTIWFNYFKGREVVQFMNSLRYDAMALGNHEFDNGLNGLLDPLLKNVKFPILSANIRPKGPIASKISGYILPYKIINVGSEKVGIIGYTTKETPVLSNPGIHFFIPCKLNHNFQNICSLTLSNAFYIFINHRFHHFSNCYFKILWHTKIFFSTILFVHLFSYVIPFP
uniref:5'-nucleotidase n=1 Tax=Naja naja TaxID=35670 RepID=A0A8C7DVT3_NAJNA